MMLQPGDRLLSNACDAEFIAIKAPEAELDLTIGGWPPAASPEERVRQVVTDGHGGESRVGKRFVDPDDLLELLCIKAGDGIPAVDDQPLLVRDSKTLPSSD